MSLQVASRRRQVIVTAAAAENAQLVYIGCIRLVGLALVGMMMERIVICGDEGFEQYFCSE